MSSSQDTGKASPGSPELREIEQNMTRQLTADTQVSLTHCGAHEVAPELVLC